MLSSSSKSTGTTVRRRAASPAVICRCLDQIPGLLRVSGSSPNLQLFVAQQLQHDSAAQPPCCTSHKHLRGNCFFSLAHTVTMIIVQTRAGPTGIRCVTHLCTSDNQASGILVPETCCLPAQALLVFQMSQCEHCQTFEF